MIKTLVAALFAVVAMACAGPSVATVMVADIIGDFNDDPDWYGWHVQLTYDTALGVSSATPQGASLAWDVGSGDPSPLLRAEIWVSPKTEEERYWTFFHPGETFAPQDPIHQIFTSDFTQFSLIHTETRYDFNVVGAGLTLNVGHNFFGCGGCIYPSLGPDYTLDQPFSQAYHGTYGHFSLPTGQPHTEVVTVAFAPIPEPATWAFMILGFGGIGALLRRRQAMVADLPGNALRAERRQFRKLSP